MTSFFTEDWESDIRNVEIEQCDKVEDPSGYRAVFFSGTGKPFFAVGASSLMQRAENLAMAGYRASMTRKAISLVENRVKGTRAAV